jgi:hypothetical protein
VKRFTLNTIVKKILIILFLTKTVSAQAWFDDVSIHGFISQAMIQTSANEFFGHSSNTSFEFTELSVNASYWPHSHVLLSGQLLSRYAGEMSQGRPMVDFMLADISLINNTKNRFGLRIGRLKNLAGLYNETRDVPFTRPSIFLPQVIYFDRVRNMVLATDGAMAYNDWYSNNGHYSFNIWLGKAQIDNNVEAAYLFGNFPGALATDGINWWGSFWYNTPDERFKVGLSGTAIQLKFQPNRSGATFDAGTIDLIYGVASLQYNAENWSISGEYALEPIHWADFGPLFPNKRVTVESYYGQISYRLNPQVELVGRYEEGFTDRHDRDGRRLAQSSGGFISSNYGFSKILTAGIRWDINAHWMVRADYQYHNGTMILSTLENTNPQTVQQYWNLFAVQAAFRF